MRKIPTKRKGMRPYKKAHLRSKPRGKGGRHRGRMMRGN